MELEPQAHHHDVHDEEDDVEDEEETSDRVSAVEVPGNWITGCQHVRPWPLNLGASTHCSV